MEKEYFTSKEFYQFDQFTINEIGIPSAVLMERAALCAFCDLTEKLSHEDHILIIAGTGNNGGDAVALARMLYLENYKVKLLVTSKKNHSKGMQEQMKIAKNIDLPLFYDCQEINLKNATVIIEGIFGIGLSREIEGIYKTIVSSINQLDKAGATVVSLDVPSGFSANDGTIYKTVVYADYTYTFGFKKIGMDNKELAKVFGEIIVCNIGYPVKKLKEQFYAQKESDENN